MSFSTGPIFTTAGQALHTRALTGAPLIFTKMQMGDGNLGSAAIEDLTALVNVVGSVNISTLRRSDNFVKISGMFTNTDITAGFYWREIGLFAADPDAPDDRTRDILYCYQNAGNLAEYIPTADSELITKRITLVAIVSNAATVHATLAAATNAAEVGFDNTGTSLAAEDVQAALEELNAKKADLVGGKVPAAQLPNVSSVTTATLSVTGWTLGADGRYAQTVAVSNVTATTGMVIVDCDLTTDDADAKVEILAAWAGPSANEVDQGAGTLTFYSYTVPAVSIPIFVGVA